MKCKKCFFSSSIGKKTLMALTGLMLTGFLASHLIGNFLLFDFLGGAESYNAYSHALTSNPLIYGAEIILFSLIIFHICSAVKVTIVNRRARPQRYEARESLGESTFASRTMVHTGMIILIFIILHLITFKFGEEYYICTNKKECIPCLSNGDFKYQKQGSNCKTKGKKKCQTDYVEEKKCATNSSGKKISLNKPLALQSSSKCLLGNEKSGSYCQNQGEVRDIYRTVMECFSQPWYSLIYIFCILALGIHISHGLQSAFQTLGINHPRYNGLIKKSSCALAFVITIGYLIFPIFFGFIKGAGLCN